MLATIINSGAANKALDSDGAWSSAIFELGNLWDRTTTQMGPVSCHRPKKELRKRERVFRLGAHRQDQ